MRSKRRAEALVANRSNRQEIAKQFQFFRVVDDGSGGCGVHFATIGVASRFDVTRSGGSNAQIEKRRLGPRSMETSVRMIGTVIQDRRRMQLRRRFRFFAIAV